MENELVQMYGRMFEEEIKTTLADCSKEHI
jgi:hypothetical protein